MIKPGYNGARREGTELPVEQIMFRLGYVEELSAGWLVFTPSEPFLTLRTALEHLGKVLAAIAKGKQFKALQPCCENAGTEDIFCPKCGTRLRIDVEIYPEDIRALLEEFLTGTVNSIGSEMFQDLEDQGWGLWEDPCNPTIINQYADDIIINLGLGLPLTIWQEAVLTR